MKNDAGEKSFDVMKWLRATREQVYEETKHMSPEERRAWYSRRPTDPVLSRLFDRRRVPEGTRFQSEGRRGDESGSPEAAHRRKGDKGDG